MWWLAALAAGCAAVAAFTFGLYLGERARRIVLENNAGIWRPEPGRRLPEREAEEGPGAVRDGGLRIDRALERVKQIAPDLPPEKQKSLVRRAAAFYNGVDP